MSIVILNQYIIVIIHCVCFLVDAILYPDIWSQKHPNANISV